ncbi:MAG: phospholipid carrier-dependent glycosyltransferase [Candidatus Pacebacteria bacterium]|nr:phospholipid carrier-dependent glycosyltransferase [Candidatus Paceibacterota bacterium]
MKKFSPIIIGIIAFYFVTHLSGLTSLPVFADESIYVRWAQLIMDEPARYALFPLNDGKTPLFIWSLLPFQYLFSDQLYAARLVSVLVGLGQVFTMGWLIKLLGGKKKTQYLGMFFTAILPFWYFHHRMALMDGMMTLWLSLAMGGAIKLGQGKNKLSKVLKFKFTKADIKWTIFTGVSFGLAMLTKLPAILFVPALGLSALFADKLNFEKWFVASLKVAVGVVIGLFLFVLLKLHPAFGQLFSRGGDFLYPLSEVLGGAWKETIISLPNYLNYFVNYLTVPLIALVIAALFSPRNKKTHHLLLLLGLIFLAPMMLMGKVVYPRYLMSASLLFTLSATLSFENFYVHLEKQKNQFKKIGGQLILILMFANIVGASGVYMYQSIFDSDSTPFVSADKEQYLYKWSSGHGIKEAVVMIEDMAKTEKIAVATEGYFGTLPDAILMYMHGHDVTNLYVDGVGYPVKEISEKFLDRAKEFDRTLLVVNSNRMELVGYENRVLLEEWCRPDSAPCLQVWELKE